MSDADAHAPLAAGPLGMELLSFHRDPEGTTFGDAPVGYVLVVLRHQGRVLMVLVRGRECWELPGGGIEPGETPREAAVRELGEEAGQHLPADDLSFAGFARTALPDRKILYGAVFTGQTDEAEPFTPNDEIAAIHWREGDAPLPDGGELQTVDAYLAALCGP